MTNCHNVTPTKTMSCTLVDIVWSCLPVSLLGYALPAGAAAVGALSSCLEIRAERDYAVWPHKEGWLKECKSVGSLATSVWHCNWD